MKYCKLTTLLTLIYTIPFVYSQNASGEIYISNKSTRTVVVKVYPVSMVFNANKDYNILAHSRLTTGPPNYISIYDYNNGRDKAGVFKQLPNNMAFQYEFDGVGGGSTSVVGSLGYGKYKISIWWEDGPPPLPDPIT